MEDLTPFTIYLIMQADVAIEMLTFALFITGLFAVFFAFLYFYGGKEFEENWRVLAGKMLPRIFSIGALILLVVGVSPSTKTLVAMYAIPSAITAANGLELDDTAKKSVKAVNKLLDAYLKEEAPND